MLSRKFCIESFTYNDHLWNILIFVIFLFLLLFYFYLHLITHKCIMPIIDYNEFSNLKKKNWSFVEIYWCALFFFFFCFCGVLRRMQIFIQCSWKLYVNAHHAFIVNWWKLWIKKICHYNIFFYIWIIVVFTMFRNVNLRHVLRYVTYELYGDYEDL